MNVEEQDYARMTNEQFMVQKNSLAKVENEKSQIQWVHTDKLRDVRMSACFYKDLAKIVEHIHAKH